MTEVLALDLATTTGWARGPVGGVPISGSVRFGKREASANAVFGRAIEWLADLLKLEPKPTMIAIEAMLPPNAKTGYTNTETRDRLAGLHGIVRGVAHLRGVYNIEAHPVGAIRQHFIGERSLKRAKAKTAIVTRCRELGWPCDDDNAGDALATWSFACALIDPAQGLRVSPLFNRRLRIHA